MQRKSLENLKKTHNFFENKKEIAVKLKRTVLMSFFFVDKN